MPSLVHWGQHTLFDSYCAYPLRTPSLTESKHSEFDPFELLDGDSELLACLIQVQLAADEKGQTTRAFTPYSSKRPYPSESRVGKRSHQNLRQTGFGSQVKHPDQVNTRTHPDKRRSNRPPDVPSTSEGRSDFNRIFNTFSFNIAQACPLRAPA